MITKLTIFKSVYNKWDKKGDKPAGEGWDLLCIDVSEPQDHRMEEMLFYRTRPEERHYFSDGVGKTIEVGISKIRHSEGGRATIMGMIIVPKSPVK